MADDTVFKLLDKLLLYGPEAPRRGEKLLIVRKILEQTGVDDTLVYEFLLQENENLIKSLRKAEKIQKEFKENLKKLTAPPWHLGLFLRTMETPDGPRALVSRGGVSQVVGMADHVTLASFQPGEEIFLSSERNLIVGKSPQGLPRSGETALFEHYTADKRLVLKHRDEEAIVEASGPLQAEQLQPGDRVRWDRIAMMAFEKIERAEGRQYLLDDVGEVGRDQVGGQDQNLSNILSVLTTVLLDPEGAAKYGLGGRSAILMVGPPGCGKTLMARVAASEVTRLGGKRCRFGVVKPGEWLSPWVGTTEANIRNCFKSLREAAGKGPAVLFLDEIEAIGALRGGLSGHHSDKFLATLLAEMDGFSDRGNIAIIAATNRKDLVDPALLERISDTEIRVTRPDLSGARAIFGIHLPPELPYHPNGTPEEKEAARLDVIDTAVSQLYSPNGENEICELRFRDGKTRKISARELTSGRMIRQICKAACEAAFIRSAHKDAPGVCADDIRNAVSGAIARLRTTLSPGNAHAYLPDLPQDMDVVSITPSTRRVGEAHHYLMLDVE
jgi:proteasome ATPase